MKRTKIRQHRQLFQGVEAGDGRCTFEPRAILDTESIREHAPLTLPLEPDTSPTPKRNQRKPLRSWLVCIKQTKLNLLC